MEEAFLYMLQFLSLTSVLFRQMEDVVAGLFLDGGRASLGHPVRLVNSFVPRLGGFSARIR